MSKLISITVFLTFLAISFGDHERPGKYLEHDSTVINCARYKREANQHSCVLAPFSIEGPYFLPDDLERSNIAEDKVGVSLDLAIRLVNSNDCTPLPNMFVHIWHADPLGVYSGVPNLAEMFEEMMKAENKTLPPFWGPEGAYEMFERPNGTKGPFGPFGPGKPGEHGEHGGPGGPGGLDDMIMPGRPTPVNNERYLRGYQVTNEAGEVNFKTILPGWYAGRSLHIHVEVYSKNTTESGEINYIGQIFFKDDLPAELQLIEPYSMNTNFLILNQHDAIYSFGNGEQTKLKLETREEDTGYFGTMTFGINPNAHH